MKSIFIAFLSTLLHVGGSRSGINVQKQSFLRTYECRPGNRCERTSKPILSENQIGIGQHGSIQACRLVCSTDGGIWPIPTGRVVTGTNYVSIHPKNFQFKNINDLKEPARVFISDVTEIFFKTIDTICGPNCKKTDKKVLIHLKVESSNLDLNWETNEGYNLEIADSDSSILVVITSQTVYGARHGLETLSQLMAAIPTLTGTRLVILDSAEINDKPVFPHRGLLLDTGRNFLSVDDILRTIDALAASKMNILHWHATDSQSFPLEIKNLPLMTKYGAYGPNNIYTVQDMQMIKKYANTRGIRIILEIDSPSHAGAGWEWGEAENMGKLAVCVNQQPWRDYCIQPPCGQLNPVNENVYEVLRIIYKELLETFGRTGMMHLGGDELFINCWNATNEVTSGMLKLGLGRSTEDFLKIWSYVHNRQLKILNEETLVDKRLNKAIVWSSHLTDPEIIQNYLNSSQFIIQTWVEADKDLNEKLLKLGYKLIISTKDAWYLDHGFWGITKYHTWRDVYKNVIPQNPGVLGGEACMWGEYITSGALDSRVWPRTAALAERLWSDPSKLSTADAEPRLQAHIDRLTKRISVFPDAIAPEWCNQHEGQCL